MSAADLSALAVRVREVRRRLAELGREVETLDDEVEYLRAERPGA